VTTPSRTRSAVPFARQRLWLGITGVGLSVVLAVHWLLFTQFEVIWFAPEWRPIAALPAVLPIDAAIAALLVFAVHAVLLAPVEYFGGARVVRQPVSAGRWAAGWLRGVAVQSAVFAVVAGATAAVALVLRYVGAASWAPAFVAVAFTLVLLETQGWVARAMASLRVRMASDTESALAASRGIRAEQLRVVDVDDESFVGGWVGLAIPQLWIPARWTDEAHRAVLTVQLARRQAQYASGARRRGVIRTVLWQGLGMLILVPILPWELTEARTYLVLPAVATLWSFVAVLLLPTPSRTAVYNADLAAAEQLGADAVLAALPQLDRWQDDEPVRSRGVEFIFHPVPSRTNRERALRRSPREVYGGAHQLTRLTLFTSLATLSLLGRAVHCNVGRPALWALFPGD
jgi:hypothetical protein